MVVTSSIIPNLKIVYPHMGPPTRPGPQASHHLNPALVTTGSNDKEATKISNINLSQFISLVKIYVDEFDSSSFLSCAGLLFSIVYMKKLTSKPKIMHCGLVFLYPCIPAKE